MKCDGKRAESRFRLSAKRTSPFKLAVASVQSTTGSRGVRISGSNAGYTMFRGSVKGTGYPLQSSVPPSLPLPVRHRVPSHFTWTLPTYGRNKLTLVTPTMKTKTVRSSEELVPTYRTTEKTAFQIKTTVEIHNMSCTRIEVSR